MDFEVETEKINYFNKPKRINVLSAPEETQCSSTSTCQCAAVVITTQTALMTALSHAKEGIQQQPEEMAPCNAHTLYEQHMVYKRGWRALLGP